MIAILKNSKFQSLVSVLTDRKVCISLLFSVRAVRTGNSLIQQPIFVRISYSVCNYSSTQAKVWNGVEILSTG